MYKQKQSGVSHSLVGTFCYPVQTGPTRQNKMNHHRKSRARHHYLGIGHDSPIIHFCHPPLPSPRKSSVVGLSLSAFHCQSFVSSPTSVILVSVVRCPWSNIVCCLSWSHCQASCLSLHIKATEISSLRHSTTPHLSTSDTMVPSLCRTAMILKAFPDNELDPFNQYHLSQAIPLSHVLSQGNLLDP